MTGPPADPTGPGELRAAGVGQCSLDYLALVEGFPAEDTKQEARRLVIEGGGPAATAMVSLQRLGVEASFSGVVSDDDAGDRIREGLASEGLDVTGLVTRPGGESQTAFIVVNTGSGSRTILWKRPTVAPLSPEELAPELKTSANLLLVDGLMMEASLAAAALAREKGVTVLLDAGSLRPGMMDLARLSDHIVCSEKFARELAPTPEGALKELSRLKPASATVTLGPEGSVTLAAGEVFTQRAFSVDVVDTTGAGDVFHGGYAYGVMRGWDIRKTVEFASAFAALKCEEPGGRSGIPGLEAALAFIREKA